METVHENGLATFVGARRRMFGIAYRMLGSVAEAEDIVQDVWLRWQAADRAAVMNPTAFLATTTTRLAINLARSARSRREIYVGHGLPDPVDLRADPSLGAELCEALESALRMLMDVLSPMQRAAYILREAFSFSYPEIARALRLSEVNARQLISRARKHIREGDQLRHEGVRERAPRRRES